MLFWFHCTYQICWYTATVIDDFDINWPDWNYLKSWWVTYNYNPIPELNTSFLRLYVNESDLVFIPAFCVSVLFILIIKPWISLAVWVCSWLYFVDRSWSFASSTWICELKYSGSCIKSRFSFSAFNSKNPARKRRIWMLLIRTDPNIYILTVRESVDYDLVGCRSYHLVQNDFRAQ